MPNNNQLQLPRQRIPHRAYSDNAIYIMCLLLFFKKFLFLFSLHSISFLVTLWTFVPVMNECCDRPMNRTKWMDSQQGRRTFFLANNFAGHCTWQHGNMALLLLCCYNFYEQFCFFFFASVLLPALHWKAKNCCEEERERELFAFRFRVEKLNDGCVRKLENTFAWS